jgi:hypothetical protein
MTKSAVCKGESVSDDQREDEWEEAHLRYRHDLPSSSTTARSTLNDTRQIQHCPPSFVSTTSSTVAKRRKRTLHLRTVQVQHSRNRHKRRECIRSDVRLGVRYLREKRRFTDGGETDEDGSTVTCVFFGESQR